MNIMSFGFNSERNVIPYYSYECVCAQSYSTLCDSMDCSLSDPSVCGIFLARKWSGLLFPSPRDLPDPRSKA